MTCCCVTQSWCRSVSPPPPIILTEPRPFPLIGHTLVLSSSDEKKNPSPVVYRHTSHQSVTIMSGVTAVIPLSFHLFMSPFTTGEPECQELWWSGWSHCVLQYMVGKCRVTVSVEEPAIRRMNVTMFAKLKPWQ